MLVLLYGCTTCTLMVEEKKIDKNKDAAYCFKQILEAAPYKTAAVWPLTSLLTLRYASTNVSSYEHNYITIYIYIYQHLRTNRMWNKVNFKWSFTDLNSKFSFSETGCHTKIKEPNYFTHSWRENSGIHIFPLGISTMWNANSLVQGLNLGHCVHFLWQ